MRHDKQNLTDAEKSYARSLFIRRYGIAFVMIAMFVFLSIATKNFLTAANLLNTISTIAVNGCIALGACFVITAGGIDLTVGAMLAWGSVVIGLLLQKFDSPAYIPAICLVAILTCGLTGLINGFLISRFHMFPFVVTLAMQLVIRGLATAMTGGVSIPLTVREFTVIGLGKFLGVVPYPAIILVILTIIAYFLMHWTKFGRYVFAVGGNIDAARAAGVNVGFVQTMTYIISGLFTGVSACIMTARISASQPNVGVGYETDAIAACVIGGTSFAGGVATIPGTFMGIVIIGLIYNGMNLMGVQSYWQTVCKGILIVGAVLIDNFINKNRR